MNFLLLALLTTNMTVSATVVAPPVYVHGTSIKSDAPHTVTYTREGAYIVRTIIF
jgi:hypothetical protein